MKTIKNIILGVAALTALSGCSDFLDMPPRNTKVIYTIDDVRGSMSTFLYAQLNTGTGNTTSNAIRINGDYLVYPFSRHVNAVSTMMTTDLDMIKCWNKDISRPDRSGGGYKAEYIEREKWESYTLGDRIWKQVFVSVGYLNHVLKDLDNVPDYNKEIFEQVSGEARVIRAYYLLRLNQLFAPKHLNDYGIPFTFDAENITGAKRLKQTDVYKILIGEINEVLAYETAPKPSWNIFYNKKVIYAILAQTYMYKACTVAKEDSDWANAEKYAKMARADQPIESTVEEQTELTNMPDSRIVNKPHKFALIRFSRYDAGPNDYAPWGPASDLLQSPSEELWAMYDRNDIRVDAYYKMVKGIPYVSKMRINQNKSSIGINDAHALFRYSDMMLIEAEALARRGDAKALTLLNQFKAAKIPGYAGYTGNDVLGEILKERRKEFVGEEQMNWIDMKRCNAEVSGVIKQSADDKIITVTLKPDDYRYTFPLPSDSELAHNNIPQNPGWKY